jgi:hypothetical protein
MTKLILRITCGFGNQLFYIFNAISLSIDNNLEFIIDPIQIDKARPIYTKYLIFANPKLVKQEFDKKTRAKMKNVLIKQNGFLYNKINLNPNIKPDFNFLIDANSSGFFQSYKFFWHNREKIKEYLNLPNERFNLMYGKIKSFEKKTIGIHIRLTDYIKNNKYFYNYPISYYKKVLAQYNLSEYNIILFSDDTKKAITMLNFIPRDNIILADSISLDDEDQFYLLTLTNIRICPNSTFSLWTCYLNEIYNFVENPVYWFGNNWFTKLGPKYTLDDLIPKDNSRFNVLDI